MTSPDEAPVLFISYDTEDAKAAIELRRLLSDDGFQTWMAPDDIRGSGPWTEQILEAIERANALVVVISSKSTSSAHVGREVNLALDQGKPVIPVRIEDVAVSGTLHYLLALVQWVDAFPLPLRRHQEKLRSRIVDVLSDLETTVPETPPKSEVRSHVALWAAAVGLVLVTSVVAVNWIGGNRSPADETTSTSEPSPPSITTSPPTTEPPYPALPSSVSSLEEAVSALRELSSQLGLEEGAPYASRLGSTVSGSFSAQIPSEWADEDGFSRWIVGPGEGITAGDVYLISPNITNMYRFESPGIFVGVSSSNPEPGRPLPGSHQSVERGCRSSGPMTIQGTVTGRLDIWWACEGRHHTQTVFELNSPAGYLSGECYAFTVADVWACAELIETLQYDSTLARPSEIGG